jgi:predicted dehydrogenase
MHDATRREFLVQSAGALAMVALVPELHARLVPSSAAPMNVGLVGAGRQGRAILAELAKLEAVKVVAVADTDKSRADSGARRVQGAEAFTSHVEMLEKAKGLTAVVVATPTHLHKAPVIDALAAGKHVYCEGPMAHTVEDARAIAQAAASAKGVCRVGYEGRSNPIYTLARTFYRSDAVADPVSAEAQHFVKTSWRFGGGDEKAANWRLDPAVSLGLAGEFGAHQFDVATWYNDALPASVRAWGDTRLHNDGRAVPDTIGCDVLFDNKARLTYSASLANSYGGRFEVLRGSNAAMKLAWTHGWMFKEADARTQGWEVYANRQVFHNDEGITLIADATKLASQGKLKDGVGLPNPPLYYALEAWAAAANGQMSPGCDAPAALRATILAIKAAEAVATGGEVKIDAALMRV